MAIPLSECIERHVYLLKSRNLAIGAFNGKDGFIGPRIKFGRLYLFTEYHYDIGPPFGTAVVTGDTGAVVDPSIRLSEHLPSVDKITGRPIRFDEPTSQGGRGWVFTDTNEASDDIRPNLQVNRTLLDLMIGILKKQRGLDPS